MLTKEYLKALKQAETICFRLTNGKHTIEASKKVSDGIYGDHTVNADLEVDGRITDYGKNGGEISEAFGYIGSAKFCPEIQTLISFLRAGDQLKLEWIANNDSEVLTKAGFCQDELKLLVTRESKTGKVSVLTFHIDSQVSPIDSSSRICLRTSVEYSIAS